jgi:hypothetical protein
VTGERERVRDEGREDKQRLVEVTRWGSYKERSKIWREWHAAEEHNKFLNMSPGELEQM